jgi:hypothetical protein
VADTSFVGESAATLGASLVHFRIDEDARQRAARRAATAVVVAALHVVFILLLIQADWIPALHPKSPTEAPLLWLLLPKAPGTPKVEQRRSLKETPREAPVIYSLPITLPPQRSDATDPALLLGQALACGANSFEYLAPQAQARCKRVPWNYRVEADGTVVLDTHYKPPEPKPAPADIMARERYRAPVCPENVDPNAPCLAKIIPDSSR